MTYKIEKGIPIKSKSKYPLVEMEVGDSFLVPFQGENKSAQQSRISSYLWTISNHNKLLKGRKYSMRVLDEGIRVWRIK